MSEDYALSADWHTQPGDIFSVNMREYGNIWIDLGDLVPVVPGGLSRWETPAGLKTIDSIAHACNKGIFCVGNHEGRKEWMEWLFRRYPWIQIVNELRITRGGQTHIFKHGHQYTDWRVWALGADDITAFVTSVPWLRDKWYEFCRWKGWMPGSDYTGRQVKGYITVEERKKFDKLSGACMGLAINDLYPIPGPATMYLGHFHESGMLIKGSNCVRTLPNRYYTSIRIEGK